MRKIFLTGFVTLDGVMEDPHDWHFPYWSDEMAACKLEETMATDALLLGRVTYEGFAAAWPGRTDDTGYADRLNGIPKYVVSTTLRDPEWNNSHVIGNNVIEEVRTLKEGDGGDIVVHGSATLAVSLMEANLIDEYRLMIHPLVLGTGRRLFDERRFMNFLTVTETRSLPNGVTLLTLVPERDAVPSIVEEADAAAPA